MIPDSIRDNIAAHAGHGEADGISGMSFASIIDECRTSDKSGPLLRSADHLISVLQELNLSLNGSSPSECVREKKPIPEDVVYSMSSIQMRAAAFSMEMHRIMHIDDEPKLELSRVIWRIALAWNCVLARDIDNLLSEIAFWEACQQNK